MKEAHLESNYTKACTRPKSTKPINKIEYMTHTVCRFDKDETVKGRLWTRDQHLKDMKVNMATVGDYIITDESSV